MLSLRPCIRTSIPGPLSYRHSLNRFSTIARPRTHKFLSSGLYCKPVFISWRSSYSPLLVFSQRHNSTQSTPPPPGPSKAPFSWSLLSSSSESPNVSSFRKIIALAKPEQKPLLIAIGLLLVSSAVSLTIPFTVGRLIDFFSSPNPVRDFYDSLYKIWNFKQQIPLGFSLWQASGVLFVVFTIGAVANAGRAMLMRLSGK